MEMLDWEVDGRSEGVRLWEWARPRSGVRMLALELRFARPNLFLKRALKELMNHYLSGRVVGFNKNKYKRRGAGAKKI